tara:strand:+ start:114 stop:332 length:219 start_codon:yes stop_codon:yes gene_type:complete
MADTPPSYGKKEDDDWFDLDKYRQAAGVAYDYSKKKMEDAGDQERKSAAQRQEFSEKDEERDRKQAQSAYKY